MSKHPTWRNLTKGESKDRRVWFEEWITTIDNRIDAWKKTLEIDLQKKLNKSPESLLDLERYLINTYPSGAARDIQNEKVFDAIGTYMGEVFRVNLPGNQVWMPSQRILESDSPTFELYAHIGFEGDETGFDPLQSVPYVLHNKPGRDLYESFGKKYNSALERSEPRKTLVIQEPGLGGYDYQHYILIGDVSIDLPYLEDKLKHYYKNTPAVSSIYVFNEATLILERTDKYCFHLWYDDRAHVSVESTEIASGYAGTKKSKQAIAACSKRFEFWGDEDPTGKYFNDHLFLLSEIVKIPGVFVFDFKQGVFYDEM